MEQEEFENMLLEALKDSKICKKVQRLLEQSSDEEECLDDAKKIKECNEKLKNAQEECSKLKKQNEILQKDLAESKNQQKEVSDSVRDLKAKLKETEDALKPFERLIEIKQTYQALPDTVKKTLRNILSDNFEDFIVCGTDLSRIRNFAETIRVYTTKKEFDLAEKMGKILKYFISIYERMNDKAKELKVKPGEVFDDEKHIHCEGKNRVKVTRVLTCGLMLKGEVCLKALVV